MRWSEVRDRLLADPAVRVAYESQGPLHRLGAAVAVRRTAMRLSQSELASRADVTQRQISNLENGKANLTATTLVRIASALDLEITFTRKIEPIRLPWVVEADVKASGSAFPNLTGAGPSEMVALLEGSGTVGSADRDASNSPQPLLGAAVA